jgi:hypothetical protein
MPTAIMVNITQFTLLLPLKTSSIIQSNRHNYEQMQDLRTYFVSTLENVS